MIKNRHPRLPLWAIGVGGGTLSRSTASPASTVNMLALKPLVVESADDVGQGFRVCHRKPHRLGVPGTWSQATDEVDDFASYR